MYLLFTYNHRILKANLSWSPTRTKFYQFIASLFVVLLQLNLTKVKLEYLKFDLKCKNERYKHKQNFFLLQSCSMFLEFSSQVFFQNTAS